MKKVLAESDEDSRVAAHEAIREIVEKVVIHPHGPYKPVEVEIYGQLAALLRISERAAEALDESRDVLVAGTRNTRSRRNGTPVPRIGVSQVSLVAGARTRFLRLVERAIPKLGA